MTSRNRQRNGQQDGNDAEEAELWSKIQAQTKKLTELQKQQANIAEQIVTMEERMGKNKPASSLIMELQELYRKQVKLSSQEQEQIGDNNGGLICNVNILRAIRAESIKAQQAVHSLPVKARTSKAKSGARPSEAVEAIDSPTHLSAPARVKGESGRSSSVASARNKEADSVSIKAEDKDSQDTTKGTLAEQAGKLYVGAEVAYKQSKMKEDGSQWIQCTITKIIDTGLNKPKRYEVQDPFPDETGAPGQVYKASAQALIPIPPQNMELAPYSVGKHVLARYPETTTFYKAEVTGGKGGICRLKFEDDMDQEMEADRRFVLELGGKL